MKSSKYDPIIKSLAERAIFTAEEARIAGIPPRMLAHFCKKGRGGDRHRRQGGGARRLSPCAARVAPGRHQGHVTQKYRLEKAVTPGCPH